MGNSYTCVILWVLLEAYCYEDSKYVINFMIGCELAMVPPYLIGNPGQNSKPFSKYNVGLHHLLSNCRMVNSYTCVILWVLLEADFHKVSIYVTNVPIVCQMAEIHANHRPTAVKTSYGPDFRGHFSTRHALFLFSPINRVAVED